MRNEVSLRTWVERFNNGDFEAKDVATQIESGWYDWFCKDNSLANKTKRMGNIIKQFKDGGKIKLDQHYVWFKNNCPLNGPLYDDFRIAYIDTNKTKFVVQISSTKEESRYKVFGEMNYFKKALFKANSIRKLVDWINEKS
ncbi:MAG: hypothetical protein KJ847_00115 [Firmicutes bacterium]|nr:hypothetical protein [Bacillota bacterium]